MARIIERPLPLPHLVIIEISPELAASCARLPSTGMPINVAKIASVIG